MLLPKRVLHFFAALCLFCFTFGGFQSAYAASDGLFKPDSSCYRNFIYHNRTYPVDSSRKMDGEGLRFVVKKNSQSEQLLNEYQSSLNGSRWPAYTGSLGIAMALGGPIYAETKQSTVGQHDTRLIFIFSGLFLTISSYAYGQYSIAHNEKRLEKAVETYNTSAPKAEKIEVGFTPTQRGTGGEIKTQIPF